MGSVHSSPMFYVFQVFFIINTLRFYVSVCLSVRPSEAEMGVFFSLKLFILGLQRAVRYVRHATVGACRRTSNRQEHKITQRAGPEQDTIFHLHVTACRGRGSHRQDERLAWVASRGQGTSCSSSFVSKVLGANYKRANNFLPVAHKFTMCTDKKQPLNLPVMRMRVWIRHVYCINYDIGIYTDQSSYSHGKGY